MRGEGGDGGERDIPGLERMRFVGRKIVQIYFFFPVLNFFLAKSFVGPSLIVVDALGLATTAIRKVSLMGWVEAS